MDFLKSLEVDDFKSYFPFEFNYLILWDDKTSYRIDKIVYYKDNETFYQSLIKNNLNHNPITDTEGIYWQELTNEEYGNYIDDFKIQKAMQQALYSINVNLFNNDKELLKIVYSLLSAHFLIIDEMMSNNGGMANYIMSSKSVEGVSANYSIPQSILNNPTFNGYGKTEFGLKYLSFIFPRLNGYCKIARGTTTIF